VTRPRRQLDFRVEARNLATVASNLARRRAAAEPFRVEVPAPRPRPAARRRAVRGR
jgi:hypothetical protein